MGHGDLRVCNHRCFRSGGRCESTFVRATSLFLFSFECLIFTSNRLTVPILVIFPCLHVRMWAPDPRRLHFRHNRLCIRLGKEGAASLFVQSKFDQTMHIHGRELFKYYAQYLCPQLVYTPSLRSATVFSYPSLQASSSIQNSAAHRYLQPINKEAQNMATKFKMSSPPYDSNDMWFCSLFLPLALMLFLVVLVVIRCVYRILQGDIFRRVDLERCDLDEDGLPQAYYDDLPPLYRMWYYAGK